MKFLKLLAFLLFAINVPFLTSCDDDDDNDDMELSIVDTAIATDDLSILVDALTQADLVNTLQGNGPFTVFAPTNDAFQALLDSILQQNRQRTED